MSVLDQTHCDFYNNFSGCYMLHVVTNDTEPKYLSDRCVSLSFLQGHFGVFAKTLITLLKMETTSRMLQSIYYVGNKCAK